MTNRFKGLDLIDRVPDELWMEVHGIVQIRSDQSLSRVRLFVTPWTVVHKAPLSMEFSRQEYWSGLPFPSLGALPDPVIKPGSPTPWTDSTI